MIWQRETTKTKLLTLFSDNRITAQLHELIYPKCATCGLCVMYEDCQSAKFRSSINKQIFHLKTQSEQHCKLKKMNNVAHMSTILFRCHRKLSAHEPAPVAHAINILKWHQSKCFLFCDAMSCGQCFKLVVSYSHAPSLPFFDCVQHRYPSVNLSVTRRTLMRISACVFLHDHIWSHLVWVELLIRWCNLF